MTQVIRKGGSIGEPASNVVAEFTDHNEAKRHAAQLRSYLSPGEKKYYGLSYTVKKVKEKG